MTKELEYIENLYNNMYEATKYFEENKDILDTTETNQSIAEILEEQNEGLEIVYSIKQALIQAQEQEKVLEIIKKKRVDIEKIIFYGNLKDYNNSNVYAQLNQEEFELLKRCLE